MKAKALAVLALLVSVALPHGAPAFELAQSGTLPRGGTYLIAPDSTQPVAAIDLWFRAPDDGYAQAVPGVARVAATAAAAAKLVSGRSLVEIVQQAGGHLTISVFPDIIGIGVVVPASAARRALAALTAAYFASAIDATALHTAQSDATVLVVQQQYEADLLLHDLLFEQLFAPGPVHEPPLPFSASDISHVTLDQVNAFVQRAFRASNGFLTLTGSVDTGMLDAVTDGSGAGTPDAPIDGVPVASVPAPTTENGVIPAVGLAWIGPPITDERAATALDFVADYLFRPDTGVVTAALDRTNADVDVNGQFVTLHGPGAMIVTLEGNDSVATQPQVLQAISALQQPMDAATFAAARTAFLYHLGVDTQTPQEQADNLGWYAAEGAAAYAPGNGGGGEYLRAALSLDADFVAATVRRYLAHPAIVHLVVTSPKDSSS